nr:retrotransposon-related protein [Tanacetum cinerariifolium]
MYKLHTYHNQARTSQLPQDSRKTSKRVTFSIGVIPTTSVSRPQLKSNPMGDRVMRNNSQGKKQDVEEQRRNVKLSKNKTSVTACNDSLNAKTLNVNSVCATCGECVLNDKHNMCVLKSVEKPLKKTVASKSKQKPRNITRKLYEHVSKTCSWWYPKFTPSAYKWKPKSENENVNPNVSMPLGNASRTANVMNPMTFRRSTVSNNNYTSDVVGRFKDRPPMLAPGNYVQWKSIIQRYIDTNPNHELIHYCLKNPPYELGWIDKEIPISEGSPITRIERSQQAATKNKGKAIVHSLQPIYDQEPSMVAEDDKTSKDKEIDKLMALISLSEYYYADHMNAILGVYTELDEVTNLQCDYLELLEKCERLETELSKSKMMSKSFESVQKHAINIELELQQCKEKIKNDKLFKLVEIVLFIVDSGCSKHMTGNLKLLINFVEKFLGTVKFGNDQIAPILGFGNLTLYAYFAAEGILHQMSVARTPEQNGVVKRRNRTLVEAAQTMLSAVKRTRVIMESIHVNFDELPQMASDHVSSDPVLECQRMALEHDSLSPRIQYQDNVPQADRTVTTSNKLDLLFSLMFDKLLNGSSKVMSKSSIVSSADAPNQRQHHATPLNNHTTPTPSFQDRGETSSHHVHSSNMHTFYQRYPSEHRWTKDHPLEQVMGNPSQSVRTRRQLESNGEICMFALTVSQTKPKNIKEAMADSAWIESMQEELHQFD